MFLRSLFHNIAVLDRTAGVFRYKPMKSIRSLADRLDSERDAHLNNHAKQEELRLARREEAQAQRGVVASNKWRSNGVLRTSLQFSMMSGDKGLKGSVEMMRNGSMPPAAELQTFGKSKIRAALALGAFKGLEQGQVWPELSFFPLCIVLLDPADTTVIWICMLPDANF